MVKRVYLEEHEQPQGDEWLLIQLADEGGYVELNGRQRTQFVVDGPLWQAWERRGPEIAKSLGLDRVYYRAGPNRMG